MRLLRSLESPTPRTAFRWTASSRRGVVVLGLAGALMGVAGCGNIEPVAPAAGPITDPTQLYMSLRLNHRAVALSTALGYETLQLTAAPLDGLGHPMSDLPAPTYFSSDTASVTVTADGLVTALQPAQGVKVFATLQVGPVTRRDSAVINVNVTNLTPPTLTTVSIQPVAPDSAIRGITRDDNVLATIIFHSSHGSTGFLHLAARAADEFGTAISGLPFEYESLEPAVAKVTQDAGEVTFLRPGQVRMVARTTAYGITKVDTVTYTVTMPTVDLFTTVPGPTGAAIFDLLEARIRSNGIVGWANTLDESVDVVFDGPTHAIMPPDDGCSFLQLYTDFGAFDPGSSCGVGDIVLTPHTEQDLDGDGFPPQFSIQVRQFPVPGVYPFHSARLGVSGRVIVTDDPNGNAPTAP